MINLTAEKILIELRKHATQYRRGAIESIKRNNHMNDISDDETIDQRIVDAVLVDFLNYVGGASCVDFALYSQDIISIGELNQEVK